MQAVLLSSGVSGRSCCSSADMASVALQSAWHTLCLQDIQYAEHICSLTMATKCCLLDNQLTMGFLLGPEVMIGL